MNTIHIKPGEETLFRDLQEGNSVQLRVTVSPEEGREYEKGKTVRVVHGDTHATGRIVSDPLEVQSKLEDGKKTLSLVLEKS